MYKQISTIVLTFLTLRPCSAQNIDVLAGTWKGVISVNNVGITYSTEVSFEHEPGKPYKGVFHCKLQEKDPMAAKNWTIKTTGTPYTGGKFHIEGKTTGLAALMNVRGNCTLRFDLQFTVKNNIPTMSGNWNNNPCGSYGGMNIVREFSKEEIANLRASASSWLSDPILKDENGNGYLENGESGNLVFPFPSTYFEGYQNSKFVLILEDPNIVVNNTGIVTKVDNNTAQVSFSLTAVGHTTSDSVQYRAYTFIGNDSMFITERFLRIKTHSKPVIAQSKKRIIADMKGIWIGDYGSGIYNFKGNGNYEITRFNKGQYTENGKWRYFSDDQYDYLSFASSANQTSANPLSEIPAYKIITSGNQGISNDNFFYGTRKEYNGWYTNTYLYKLETIPENSSLIKSFDSLIQGKWAFDGTMVGACLNFKENHDATQYNIVNQSDKGSWFWTYRMEDGEIHFYLWTVLGKTFGTSKYEVLLQKSSYDKIYLKDSKKPQASEFSISRAPDIDVPEINVGTPIILGGPLLKLLLSDMDESGIVRGLFEGANEAGRRIPGEQFYQQLLDKVNSLQKR